MSSQWFPQKEKWWLLEGGGGWAWKDLNPGCQLLIPFGYYISLFTGRQTGKWEYEIAVWLCVNLAIRNTIREIKLYVIFASRCEIFEYVYVAEINVIVLKLCRKEEKLRDSRFNTLPFPITESV